MLRMNDKPLECSSGCESGWTMYLDQSFGKPSWVSRNEKEGEEQEEDLSMVSDASSGPPHFIEDDDYFDENGFFCSASSVTLGKKIGKRSRKEAKEQEQKQHPSLLEDTASSHVFTLSKNSFNNNNKASMEDVFDFSQGFSATHFKGKPPLQKHFGFLNPTLPVKSTSTIPVCRKEKGHKIW